MSEVAFKNETDNLTRLYYEDLFVLGEKANNIRKKRFDKKVFFNLNRHINPTNICSDVCKFCAFSAHRKNPNPYALSLEEIVKEAREARDKGAKEIHIVGAHNPDMGIEFYANVFKAIKSNLPDLHIKALTAAEVDFFARSSGKSYEDILKIMRDSGVDSMPGGGAEIFEERVREKICKGKVSSKGWLEIHRLWHKMGKKSNATMLFGHIEERKDRIDHMLRLKALQDEYGGFNCFIPLLYQKENNFLDVKEQLSGVEILKTYAVSRIVLDNIPHLKAYWVTSTINLALVACEFGADDLDGTIQKESINSAAGADSKNGLSINEFVHKIKDAGFTPIERDSLYNEIGER